MSHNPMQTVSGGSPPLPAGTIALRDVPDADPPVRIFFPNRLFGRPTRNGTMLRSRFYPLLVLSAIVAFTPGRMRAESGTELHKKARALAAQKKITEAEDFYRRAAEASPRDGWILADCGQFHLWQTKKYATALDFFNRALGVKYEQLWVFRQKGIALLRLGRPDAAESVLKEAVSRAQSDIRKSDDRAKAERELTASAGWLADIYVNRDEYSPALSVLDQAVALVPHTKDETLSMAGLRAASSLGHQAFGRKEYNAALGYFASAKSYASRSERAEDRAEAADIDLVAKLVEKRRALGTLRPLHQYRIQVVFIPRTDVDFVSLKGEKVEGRRELTDSMRFRTRWMAESVARQWEALTDGKLEVEVRFAEVDAVLSHFHLRESKNENTMGREIREPDLEKSSDELVKFFGKRQAETDTFVMIWNGEGISTTANGGSRSIPIDDKSSIIRGFVHISAERLLPPGGTVLFMHEMQHTIEAIVGNLAVDGKLESRKRAFPQCDGSGEVRFFACHFEKILPERFSDKTKFKQPGFQNFNYRMRMTKEKPRAKDRTAD